MKKSCSQRFVEVHRGSPPPSCKLFMDKMITKPFLRAKSRHNLWKHNQLPDPRGFLTGFMKVPDQQVQIREDSWSNQKMMIPEGAASQQVKSESFLTTSEQLGSRGFVKIREGFWLVRKIFNQNTRVGHFWHFLVIRLRGGSWGFLTVQDLRPTVNTAVLNYIVMYK